MRRVLMLVPLVALLACGGDDDDEGASTVATVTESSGAEPTAPSTTRGSLVPATDQPVVASTVPSSSAPAPPPSGPPTAEETAAIADLAAREGVEPSAITTVSVEEVTWRDSAIGCPEPGMSYLQVLTDGVRIVLELDGTRYQYHSGGSRPVFYCENPAPALDE